MTKFRGCIDLHGGSVKQIVGGTLDSTSESLKTNFISEKPPAYYGNLYRENEVRGTHVIKLGPNNDEAAVEALHAYPNELQIGGGITAENALFWINEGKASKVIVTSWLFPEGKLSMPRLEELRRTVGKEHIVIDLSCRKRSVDGETQWIVAMNKWQTLTDTVLSREVFKLLEDYCSEFLIHAADVEGLCRGIDEELVGKLAEWTDLPVTYAGGARSIEDLETVKRLSGGKVDLTYGSSLDIFGGDLVKFADCVEWNKKN